MTCKLNLTGNTLKVHFSKCFKIAFNIKAVLISSSATSLLLNISGALGIFQTQISFFSDIKFLWLHNVKLELLRSEQQSNK